jgi:hypothetical protein
MGDVPNNEPLSASSSVPLLLLAFVRTPMSAVFQKEIHRVYKQCILLGFFIWKLLIFRDGKRSPDDKEECIACAPYFIPPVVDDYSLPRFSLYGAMHVRSHHNPSPLIIIYGFHSRGSGCISHMLFPRGTATEPYTKKYIGGDFSIAVRGLIVLRPASKTTF